MTTKVLLASADERTLERLSQVLAEADAIELVQVVREAANVEDALTRHPDVDVLVVDELIDSGRGLGVARTVGAANPLLGIVMLVDQAGPEQFAAAMESGARSVLSRTSSLAEVVSRLESVAHWVGAARSAVSADARSGRAGRVVAVAGAKGGVGASAVALLMAQSLVSSRTVGLVDFDLQSGDLAAYLGVHTRRSVVDLVDIAGEMTGRILRETSYDVPGGIRLLSAPNDGERGEEMTARAARSVVNALRYQYEVSIIDVGSHLTEATAAVLEEADVAVLVVTPDLPALRAARRTLAMWERLVVRQRSAVRVLLNRQHRRNEVTESLAAKIVESRVDATVPDGGSPFESAMNTASVAAASGPAHTAAAKFAAAVVGPVDDGPVDAVEEAYAEVAGRGRRRARGNDAGQSAVELPVAFAVALMVLLLAGQGLVWGTGYLLARNAAHEGARTVGLQAWGPSTPGAARADALDELSGRWRSAATVDVSPSDVTVHVVAPTVVPGVRLTSSVSAPVQREH
ncbi:AAA family ATPase [Cellulomonas sp. KH9]|uniref:AAA family ATPase n=1 Tax=Cellulomonas sp. KH9 TaxID=1855324 RepID=UPI0008E0D268|nr:AAA family ATPase [Cellulomonas sp. KH9]SFJ82040.1 pilus assembly protein CpaE [Cellulomonas sp. KH9]